MFRYTTALNHLLRSNSKQKIQIGEMTTAFWAERGPPVEGFMGFILGSGYDKTNSSGIGTFLRAARDGKRLPDIKAEDTAFYVLGLSPNGSRNSIRFWHMGTVGGMANNIGQHFSDLLVVRRPCI